MEALIELIVAIAAFIFEAMMHSIVFSWILLSSLFSPRYRAKLKEWWATSNWDRFAMILGATLYSFGIAFTILVWLQLRENHHSTASTGQSPSGITIQFTHQISPTTQPPKPQDTLVEAAASFIQRKLHERKAKAAQEKAASEVAKPAAEATR